MQRKYLFTAIIILIILLGIYYYLGGFNEARISTVEDETYVVAGYRYDGPYNEDQLNELFFRIREYTESGQYPGVITVVNYGMPKTGRDSIRQLIGIRLEGDPLRIPDSLTVDTLSASRVLRAELVAHPLTMPRPDEIDALLRQHAEQEGLRLKDTLIEQYIARDTIWIDALLLSNSD
jgi:hypothetical protein